MTKPDLIRGSVARVEDQYTILLNRGSEHGVQVGMIFAVLSDGGDPLIDPETGDVIAEFPTEKLRVRVAEVHEKYSRAETYLSTVRQPVDLLPSLARLQRMAGPANYELSPRLVDAMNARIAETNRELFEKMASRPGSFSIDSILGSELSKPQKIRQKISDAAPVRRSEEAPFREEVAVAVGDKVVQVPPKTPLPTKIEASG